ncbi:MAG: PaaI family thioesterase [Eubacteriales bacterium]|nr:PaaI family thioesterase [Eubacteriales bacterium]
MVDFEYLKMLRDGELFGAQLGLKHTLVEEGHACTELVIKPEFINLQGTIHGGILLTLADVTGGTAACSYGKIVATVDNSYHFLRASKTTTRLTAEASTIKAGRRIIVVDVKVRDQDGELMGEGIFSYMPLDIEVKQANEQHES